MRAAFLLLLLANVALLAWQQGLLGAAVEAGREPERVARQISPDKFRVLTAEQLAALRSAPKAAAGVNAKLACYEFGDFDEASLARVQSRLAALALGERLRTRPVGGPGWVIVYLPPPATRAEADRLAQDLRGRGIRDLMVMGPNSPMPNAIVLGTGSMPTLVVGQEYEVQLLVFDGRGESNGKTVSVDGINQGIYGQGISGVSWGDSGLLLTGTFTADASTQAITLETFEGSSSRGGLLNALVLNTIPEPSAALLGSLASFALLRRRRERI